MSTTNPNNSTSSNDDAMKDFASFLGLPDDELRNTINNMRHES